MFFLILLKNTSENKKQTQHNYLLWPLLPSTNVTADVISVVIADRKQQWAAMTVS